MPKTIELLERLVAFDTVSSRSNVELIEWVANHLDGLGVRAMVQMAGEPGKANLFATIGPDDRPGLMLSGHSDVVPVEGQAWQSDPFRLTHRDGRVFARGSADMKGFIACVLAQAPTLVRADLRQPVHIALSYNEESDMGGMRQLAAHLSQASVKPAACIIGEPTSMRVVVANKGAAIYRCHVRGHSVHSSLRDDGVSAVEVAADLVAFITALQRRLRDGPRHDGFEFPYTSLHVGTIAGGTAHNITASDCSFLFEIRALPGVSSQEVLGEIRHHAESVLLPAARRIAPNCAIEFEEVVDSPGLDERGNHHLAETIMPICGCLAPGRVSFGTEAGFLADIGVPTIVCGPGEIRVAHQPDEHVSLDQLDACDRFLAEIGHRLTRQALV
ncbi:MAG: acetylornithine deacetylase [Burkholderiaceae bacterium]|nr:acetylornithine deacetylase [Burkholderiaceae bacterium]